MLERILGKKQEMLTADELTAWCDGFEQCHLDLGTGDGLFAWRLARDNPHMLVLGLDADRDSLREGSARAAKKPARGGAPNALFFCADALNLPDAFKGVATSLSINYPWGSLLKAVVDTQVDILQHMAICARSGASVTLTINLFVFDDEEQRQNLQLPTMNEEYLHQSLMPAWEKAGVVFEQVNFFAAGEDAGVSSTWGGRLTRNSKRPTLQLAGHKK